MINNVHLQRLYLYEDRDIILCQILNYTRESYRPFFEAISRVFNLEDLTDDEKYFIVCVTVLVKYKGNAYPKWMDDERLSYKEPVFYNKKHISEKQKQELLDTAPDCFKYHNLYFLLQGLERL